MFSKVRHQVVAYIMTSFLLWRTAFHRTDNTPHLFMHLSADKHLHFYLLAIINNAATKHLRISLCVAHVLAIFSLSVGGRYVPRSGTAVSRDNSVFGFLTVFQWELLISLHPS